MSNESPNDEYGSTPDYEELCRVHEETEMAIQKATEAKRKQNEKRSEWKPADRPIPFVLKDGLGDPPTPSPGPRKRFICLEPGFMKPEMPYEEEELAAMDPQARKDLESTVFGNTVWAEDLAERQQKRYLELKAKFADKKDEENKEDKENQSPKKKHGDEESPPQSRKKKLRTEESPH